VQTNQETYSKLYSRNAAFLRWPADWVLRFRNMYLNAILPPKARILDFGCGSANNSIPFMKDGHVTHGIDVSESIIPLVKQNLEFHGLSAELVQNYIFAEPPLVTLPYEDDSFDFVLSNQVHYYSTSESELHTVNRELHRVMKPGAVIFATMMGPKNYYITRHLDSISPDGSVYHVRIKEPKHRLFGVAEDVLLTRDEDHLRSQFAEFEPVTVGHFSQSMFDMTSNFHYIFIGRKMA